MSMKHFLFTVEPLDTDQWSEDISCEFESYRTLRMRQMVSLDSLHTEEKLRRRTHFRVPIWGICQ